MTTQKTTVLSLSEMTDKRRIAVSHLSQGGLKPAQIAAALQTQGIVNPKTGKAFSRQTIRGDLRATVTETKTSSSQIIDGFKVSRRPLSETIGQYTFVKPQWNARILLNVDATWRDLVFWDALRRGTAPGYELSGPAFCMPAAQTIASYAFGKGIRASLVESAVTAEDRKVSLHEAAWPLTEVNGKPTQNKKNALGAGKTAPTSKPGQAGGQFGKTPLTLMPPKPKAALNPNASDRVAWTNLQIQHMLEANQGFLLGLTIDEYCLGNQYVICNSDCTFSIASPETVTIEYSASDYRKMLRVIITTKMQQARVQDTYTDEKRTITVEYYDRRATQVFEYENLIGRIPVIHFPNDRSANEIYGRPIYEAGLPIMWRYDALINNMLEGVTLLGTPIPMFTGLENPTQAKIDNSEAVVYTDESGQQQTNYVTRLDRQTGIYLGKGADGKMLSTNVGFTKDAIDALHQLKLLWLHETHIPEFILGGAIASSKASTESQMPPFIQYINFRRLMLEGQGANPALSIEARGGLLELLDVWLRTYKLLNPDIVVAPVSIEWPEIDVQNDQVKYLWGTYLSGTGKITDETTLKMSGYFADPAAEVSKAAGKKTRPPEFDTYEEKLRLARLETLRQQLEPPDDDGPPFSTDYVTPAIDLLNHNPTAGSVAAHQHADGAAMGDPWDVNGPLFWLGMYGSHNG